MEPQAKREFIEVVAETLGRDTIEIRSKTSTETTYKVDTVNGRCSCPAWKFQSGGARKPCKHLKAMGYGELKSTKGMK